MYIADISEYQGNIDWNKARKELEMVIFRASIGNKKDSKYVKNAKECGIPFGVYHYFKASTIEEAKEETKFFYNCAIQEGLKPLFFVPDIEYKTQTSKNTKSICQMILSTLKDFNVKKIGLYIGQERYSYMKDIKNSFHFIWIPRYGKNTSLADEYYAPIYPCDIWQYTDKGKIDGITGNVDLNKLCGDKSLEWFTKDGLIIEPPLKRSIFYLRNQIVKKNDYNEAVKELQILLNSFGYQCDRNDGFFDENTEKALIAFQKNNGLTADGICGPKTINKIIG